MSELIQKARTLAALQSNFHDGLRMANILSELHCDDVTIAAAILYPAVCADKTPLDTINTQVDPIVAILIAGALKMQAIHDCRAEKNRGAGQQNQMDNLRKMLLAMVDDVRTIYIKLAAQLIYLQDARNASSEQQKQIAQDTMDYYAPLANRLGIGQLKWQLEDWAFRYLDPSNYQEISQSLQMTREKRLRYMHDMIAQLKKILADAGLKTAKVSGRIKHIYSIYRKIKQKQVNFSEIYDANALRILVPTIEDCYTALSIVHATWEPIAKEFDDYIAKPKSNGYQSIHTALRTDNALFEIQIRTNKMHENSEIGVASHWSYKENKKASALETEKIAWLRALLDWQEKSLPMRDVFSDRVYVFSPTGHVFDLKTGSTPLDFAYLIHTNVGHRCHGAKVNGALVPLTHALKTGDRVTILTQKDAHPSRDWMRPQAGYLKTQHAIRKVKLWFKQQDFEKNVASGLAIWEKYYKQHELSKNAIDTAPILFNLKNKNALLAAIGAQDISLVNVLHKLKLEKNEKKPRAEKIKKQGIFRLSAQGSKHLLTQMARCCHPVLGDAVIGYITQGRGISVHKKSCHNIVISRKRRPEKLIELSWDD